MGLCLISRSFHSITGWEKKAGHLEWWGGGMVAIATGSPSPLSSPTRQVKGCSVGRLWLWRLFFLIDFNVFYNPSSSFIEFKNLYIYIYIYLRTSQNSMKKVWCNCGCMSRIWVVCHSIIQEACSITQSYQPAVHRHSSLPLPQTFLSSGILLDLPFQSYNAPFPSSESPVCVNGAERVWTNKKKWKRKEELSKMKLDLTFLLF